MLSVVVATYLRYDILPDCIEALRGQTLNPNALEILIVDNSPDAEESLRFGTRYSNVKNLRWIHQSSVGLSKARNRGIRESRFPIIAFIDDDALAVANWAEELIKTFEYYGDHVAGVGGRIDLGWRTPRPRWLHSSLCKFLTTIDYGPDRKILGLKEEIAGANMAFRKSVFEKLGLFPESLGRKGSTLLSSEETRLLFRIHEAGHSIAYAPEAKVEHVVDPSRLVQSWFRKRVAWQAVSEFIDAPEVATESMENHWRWMGDYFLRVPAGERNLRGLLRDCDDPEVFAQQVSAIYDAIVCLLGAYNPDSGEKQRP